MPDQSLREQIVRLLHQRDPELPIRMATPEETIMRERNALVIQAVSDDLMQLIATEMQRLHDEIVSGLPNITLNEVIDEGQFPKSPEAYDKMVWLQDYYKAKATAHIAACFEKWGVK